MVETAPFGVPMPIDGPAEVERLNFVIGTISASLERLAGEQSLSEVRDIIRAQRAATGRRRRP